METETMTVDDGDSAEPSVPADRSKDPAISDAESTLDNLLEVVREQAEDILGAARSDARAETEAAFARAASERDRVLASARIEADEIAQAARTSAAEHCASALTVVEASIAELNKIEEYRSRLEALAGQLRNATRNVGAYHEVDPDALQMLAGELGEDACRVVIDTFAAELSLQLEDLAVAVQSDDLKSKKIVRILHNMSSGCATVGAAALAELCNEVTPATLPEHLDQIVRRGNIVRAEVIRVRDRELTAGDPTVDVGEDAP